MVAHIIFRKSRQLFFLKLPLAHVAGLKDRDNFQIRNETFIRLVRFLVKQPHTKRIVKSIFPRAFLIAFQPELHFLNTTHLPERLGLRP
ncbi:MAG TPA: hypothetical protein DEH09_14425 [Alcanivorax sp.]|nr:hypothetical protein [Alcanivorax sp.]HCI11367.1 hypothetical protein [Alcanivorax sp.]